MKDIFHKLEWFNLTNTTEDVEVTNISGINVSDRDAAKNIKKHYKHAQRWQLANTLTNIYGYDKALQYMVEICKDTPYKELKGDCKTAEIHQKPISIWAVKQLNEYHGFNLKFDDAQNMYNEQQKALENINDIEITEQPTGLQQTSNLVTFHINKNQYLGDIKDDIIKKICPKFHSQFTAIATLSVGHPIDIPKKGLNF